LASLSGLSVDYLVRLEQGRARNPSPQVLASLARALRLSMDERDTLYRTAGIAPPSDATIATHLSPGVQRIVDHLADTPVGIYTAAWDFVSGNQLWSALFGHHDAGSRDSNLIWRAFVSDDLPLLRSAEASERFAEEMVGDLHAAKSVYPHDRNLTELIDDLRRVSPKFEGLWNHWKVANRHSEQKVVNSPVVGPITFDCDVMSTTDSNLRVVVYTVSSGSADANKLELLKVVGSHT
jgi:transcriptional regulator with XRE-family HTH domain